MKTAEEILDYMDGYRVEGEDAGAVIQELKEPLPRTAYLDLGEVKYFEVDESYGPSQLTLLMFEDENYKFICIEETEVIVHDSPSIPANRLMREELKALEFHGGTCYSGTVEVYKKLTKRSPEERQLERDKKKLEDISRADIRRYIWGI